MNAIGIDVGSSNVKAVLVDSAGSLLDSATRPLETSHDGQAVTQDPLEVWEAVQSAVRNLVAGNPSASALITDIGVCSQYSSMVVLDRTGQPVTPIIMYMDRRGTDECWAIMERHPEAFEVFVERHGIPPIGAGLTLSHMLAVESSGDLDGVEGLTYLEVMDFVNHQFTGRAVATQATMFASQLCDNRLVGSTSYDPDLVFMAGVNPQRLPELVDLESIIGTVRADVATDLGLPEQVRVHAAMNDTQAAAFATGVLPGPGSKPRESAAGSTHSVGVMIGTTSVVIDSAPAHKVDLDREVLTMPSPLAGRHLVMAENGLAGRSVERFFELVGLDLFGPSTQPTEVGGLEAVLERSKPGASGLLFLPWLDGSMSPAADPSIRGGLIGLSLTHTRDDLARAAIEGTAFNLAWLLPAVEELTGSHADRIVLGGGAARSAGWAQVLSDVTQRPVDVLENPTLGAALAVARVALQQSTGESSTAIGSVIGRTFEPDNSTTELYRSMQEQFEVTFSTTRSICEALGHG